METYNIYSPRHNKTFICRLMTHDEKKEMFLIPRNSIITSFENGTSFLTHEEVTQKTEVLYQKFIRPCYINETKRGNLFFSEYDMNMKWTFEGVKL
jgi:hypothetical protein